GANVATQRAFVMVAVMLVALILDRRAISLRAVALAALIVMVLRPESVAGPGFQMSFAATTALVTVFAWLRDRRRGMPPGGRVPRFLAPVAALALSSLIAGLATAPIAAAHFNMVSRFGYPANLVSVPVMGILVMPGGILAVLGMPLGLEGAGLALMRLGVGWILRV
ncbi:ComEC/Rec2 family competence protein, partial [Brevirhabdus pacifica]